jgi:hypothetical protein
LILKLLSKPAFALYTYLKCNSQKSRYHEKKHE